jgi:hypothetical protein
MQSANTNQETPNNNWFVWVLFVVTILWLTCITSSCGVLKNHYLQKYCQSKDSISERTEIIYKDTTLYISSPKDSIIINNPCDSIIKIVKEKNGLKMSVNKSKGKLTFTCEADSLKAVIKTLQETKSKYQYRTIEKKVNELTRWQSFLIVSAYIFFALLIVYLIIRIIRLYLHI